MDTDKARQLLNAVTEVVSAEGAWKDKKAAIIAESSEDERGHLSEFVAWFEEEETAAAPTPAPEAESAPAA